MVTIGVYGLVGVIVKLDDMGYWLAEKRSALGAVAGVKGSWPSLPG